MPVVLIKLKNDFSSGFKSPEMSENIKFPCIGFF